jgi:hypothetical protein
VENLITKGGNKSGEKSSVICLIVDRAGCVGGEHNDNGFACLSILRTRFIWLDKEKRGKFEPRLCYTRIFSQSVFHWSFHVKLSTCPIIPSFSPLFYLSRPSSTILGPIKTVGVGGVAPPPPPGSRFSSRQYSRPTPDPPTRSRRRTVTGCERVINPPYRLHHGVENI